MERFTTVQRRARFGRAEADVETPGKRQLTPRAMMSGLRRRPPVLYRAGSLVRERTRPQDRPHNPQFRCCRGMAEVPLLAHDLFHRTALR